jgi:crotonobetainyl-CoA:carnitine CoA-transferase CaiB-like acyl-CoA transferase
MHSRVLPSVPADWGSCFWASERGAHAGPDRPRRLRVQALRRRVTGAPGVDNEKASVGMTGPLHGVVVLDLTRILAGPWATQVLADFGAEVIKIEHPRGGDDTRRWGPPYLEDEAGQATGESAYYLSANRGKQSVAIDFSREEGQALVRSLAGQADVLVENFKVGGLTRFGLGAEDMLRLNPRLVYVSISAFGQDGPAADEPGYDAMIQAMGGLMSITGVPDGQPGAGPQKVGVAVADLMCGMYAVSAILAALHERTSSGRGQAVDLALLDTQVAWLANQGLNYLVGGVPPCRQGTAHPNIVPYQAFATSDGHLMLAVGNDAQFARFCTVAGAPELATDTRFTTNDRRVENRSALVPAVTALIGRRTTGEWLDSLRRAQVPCGPINDLAQVFAEPQVRHRGMRLDLPHPLAGTAPGIRNPVRFARTPIDYGRSPPLLGADTADVLRTRLGLDAATLAGLAERGVIA